MSQTTYELKCENCGRVDCVGHIDVRISKMPINPVVVQNAMSPRQTKTFLYCFSCELIHSPECSIAVSETSEHSQPVG